MRRKTDDELRAWWRSLGGDFHGPNVEHGTIEESRLLPLLRESARDTELATWCRVNRRAIVDSLEVNNYPVIAEGMPQ